MRLARQLSDPTISSKSFPVRSAACRLSIRSGYCHYQGTSQLQLVLSCVDLFSRLERNFPALSKRLFAYLNASPNSRKTGAFPRPEPGLRILAIGDVHGCAKQLEEILKQDECERVFFWVT